MPEDPLHSERRNLNNLRRNRPDAGKQLQEDRARELESRKLADGRNARSS
jgi:hypothetical protein